MKKLSLLLVAILIAVTGILAQTPEMFKYQAVLRDASGNILTSETVTVDISILQGSASGTSVFDESHNVTTTAQGLINLNIGSVSDLSTVDFSVSTYFVEISVNGTVMGTSQLLSVPYALQAKTAENVFSGDYNDLTNQPILFDGDYNSLTNQPTLFDGSYNSLTDLPTLFSGDYGDLTNAPTNLSNFTNDLTLFDGVFGSLTGTPTTLAGYGITDAFSGSYTDLTSKPVNATTSADGFMSSADKTKLNGIATGAEVNVNADWNASSGDAQILNKPTILPAADGSETKVTEGTNITVTGAGTTASPYVVNASGGPTHTIGQSYQGGKIFWLDATGQHGLIVATADQSTSMQWYNGTYRYTGTTGDGLYAGSMNTTIIVATQMADNQTGNFAAKVCADYSVTVGGVTYGDWYLPSKYELNLLYLQKDVVGGITSTAYYWSSTEGSNGVFYAWWQRFYSGTQGNDNKNAPCSVRAVRAF